MVSNLAADGAVVAEDGLRLLNLKTNFIWHTDSTFLPTPAISNVLTAYKVPSSGGETEFASTRVGWRRLSDRLKQTARDVVIVHRYAHSRSLVDATLARQEMFTRWPDTPWRPVWRNPVIGCDALYLGAHACGVLGMTEASGQALIRELNDAMTRDDAIYSHQWRVGDVLIWDQRATLHRGRPWPYEEERTLARIVSNALESDGIDSVKL